MISSKPISSSIQPHFHGPSIPFTLSQSHNLSFKFINTRFVRPVISNRKISKLSPMTATINDLCMPSPEDTLYDLLGISESGTLYDIKQAYKQMALKYHPDVSPPEQADEYTTRFIRVQEAYETLSDPNTRAMYDGTIVKGFHLGFSGNKGFRSDIRSEEKALWKNSWQVQLVELRQRSMMKKARVDQGESQKGGHGEPKSESNNANHVTMG